MSDAPIDIAEQAARWHDKATALAAECEALREERNEYKREWQNEIDASGDCLAVLEKEIDELKEANKLVGGALSIATAERNALLKEVKRQESEGGWPAYSNDSRYIRTDLYDNLQGIVHDQAAEIASLRAQQWVSVETPPESKPESYAVIAVHPKQGRRRFVWYWFNDTDYDDIKKEGPDNWTWGATGEDAEEWDALFYTALPPPPEDQG